MLRDFFGVCVVFFSLEIAYVLFVYLSFFHGG